MPHLQESLHEPEKIFYPFNFGVYFYDPYYTKKQINALIGEINIAKYIDSSTLTKGRATGCKQAYLLTCSNFL